MRAGGGILRRTCAGRLTTARDLQYLFDIDMGFEVVGERIESNFDPRLIGDGGRDAEIGKPRLAKGIAREQAVDVGPLHPAVGRDVAVVAALDLQHWPRAISALAAAEVNFVSPDGSAGRMVRAGNERCRLVVAHDGGDIEQAEALDGAGTAVEAIGVSDGSAEHLVPAAQPEHVAAAANMRVDVDIPALPAQKSQIANRGVAAGKNDDFRLGGDRLSGPHEDQLDARLHAEG